MKAAEFKKGIIFRHNGEIWRVTRKEVTAVGTHSHTKIKVFAKPLRGGGEKSYIFAHEDKIEDLDIMRKNASIISKTHDSIQIMDAVSYETVDVKCDPDVIKEMNEGDAVIYVEIDGNYEILENPNG
jgi:translation elongation factor P/translation initiation factor 5A